MAEIPVFDEKGKLLVIDDEPEIIRSLKRQFRKRYEVYVAESAEGGYKIMTENEIHVIISDQRMPGMTGTEFFRAVKSRFPDAIRLILTGYADIRAVIGAINDGNIFRYITKPWEPGELDTIVDQAFEHYRLTRQNRQLLEELKRSNEILEECVRQRTAELEKANEVLKALNQQKDDFLGIAAHDLRNPLGAIIGFARIMLDDEQVIGSESLLESFDIILQNGEHMLTLLDNFLDVSVMERGHINIQPKPLDPAEVMDVSIKLNRILAQHKGIELTAEIAPELSELFFDPEAVHQVLNNLIGNALKYSKADTRIHVRMEAVPQGARISVTDEGPGISKEEQKKLFTDFGFASSKPTGNERSSGLGLSICRRIVEAHHGTIGVESEPGTGSCFYFEIPAAS